MRLFDPDNWQEIWMTITRNKTRSILTAFGVSWGIFMLVILLGMGGAFRDSILGSVDGLEVRSAYFWSNTTSEPYKGHNKYRYWNIDNRDLDIIQHKARSVDLISPMLARWDQQATRGNKKNSYTVLGMTPEQNRLEKHIPIEGRLLSEADNNGYRKVCVIGEQVYQTLFDIDEQAVGKFVRVGDIYYQIVGVIIPAAENASIMSDPKRTIYMPFNTMQRTFNLGTRIHQFGVTPKAGYPMEVLIDEVKRILKENHEIAPTDDNAVYVANLEEQFAMINNIFLGIDILVWIVGLGALLSGIIGISNIMLVTVRERMREIGIRRALGAQPGMILWQIMSESFVLTTLAGLGGMTVGLWILALVGFIFEHSQGGISMAAPTLSFGTAMAAMGILIVSALLAGIIPAIMAMRAKAIDAIRDE